jgi:hypothetical protein
MIKSAEETSHREHAKDRRSRAVAQAEGLISLPTRRINLWTTPSRMSRPALTVKTRRIAL